MEDLRERRRALEVLAKQGLLYCKNHRDLIEVSMLYRKKCYSSQRADYEMCPYLTLRKQRQGGKVRGSDPKEGYT